ncbi:hypothetical protein FOZ63_000342 [Perkinsus olseni]|uniref:Uncharacterized protein n=1 Tax=Perkinsus olseni TaxID=32597 RepID=A0A7J6S2B9_PEROL|nr:hypothetical protein FOZ63_000342 [Perkinsus olseni]
MALKGYTIGASAVAGALVCNLLLSKSIGAVAANDSADDMFVLLHAETDLCRVTRQCKHFHSMICSGRPDHLAGRSSLSYPYGTVYPYHGEPWYYFIDHPLPDDTGLDPLRELPWNFDHELRRLYRIANNMTFKPGASWIPTDSMLEAAEDRDEDAIETINTIEGVCSAVVMAMKKYFGTFEELCSKYRHVCGEALQTTWLEDWVIDEQDVYGRNLVYRRHKYIKSAQ